MVNVLSSVSCKNEKDTRNNWVTFMFKCKSAYYCFEKQSHIDTCAAAFKEHERFGFEFREIGFGGNHVHFQVNVPKRYSLTTAEIMLKSKSSLRIFEQHPGFRKRYPRGSFWSGYEHHQSTGLQDIDESAEYIRNQTQHHNITVVDDRQMHLATFNAE
ncbi:Transposase IS200 like protein [uncultured archaeon]|nr:Transposase IS200 like protein [uncultured archaeon]